MKYHITNSPNINVQCVHEHNSTVMFFFTPTPACGHKLKLKLEKSSLFTAGEAQTSFDLFCTLATIVTKCVFVVS